MIYDPSLGLIFIKTLKVSGSSFEVALSALLSKYAIATISTQWPTRGGPSDALEFRRTNWLPLGQLMPQVLRNRALARDIPADIVRRRGPRHEIFAVQKEHWSAEDIRRRIGIDEWNRCIKIEIARNPYDRLVSNYFMKKGNSQNPLTFPSFRQWLINDPDLIIKNERLVSVEMTDGSLRPDVDLILYYENMEHSLEKLASLFNFDADRIISRYSELRIHGGFRPRDGRGSVEQVIDSESKAVIDTILKLRFDRLGYKQVLSDLNPTKRTEIFKSKSLGRHLTD